MAKITLGGEETETSGELPAVGSQAKGFQLVGGGLSPVTLEDFSGKRKLLNIFPSIDTGVCAQSVREFYRRLAGLDDVVVLNISMDLPFAQQRFCDAEQLENAVTLSAFNSSFPEDYGVKIMGGPFAGLCARAVLILDETNQVVYQQLVPEIGSEPDYLAALGALGIK